jgi:lipid-binding SYLF domain-containing protein
MITRRTILAGAFAAGTLLALGANAASGELESAAGETLARLTSSEPAAAALAAKARGILIFPEIVKGGALLGAAGGKGVLRVGGKSEGTYQSSAVSFGLQLGVSKFGYVMMLMDDSALDYLRKSDGWEVGVGPNVTVVDQGMAGKLTTTSARDGVYVFFVDQKGLFAGAGIEGTKISRVSD